MFVHAYLARSAPAEKQGLPSCVPEVRRVANAERHSFNKQLGVALVSFLHRGSGIVDDLAFEGVGVLSAHD